MGELLAIVALGMFSANILITRTAASRLNLNFGFLVAVIVNILFASLLLMIQFLFREDALQWNTPGFFLFLLAGFSSTYLGRWLFMGSIVKLGPAKASTFQVSNPLFTVIIAWIFLHENLGSAEYISIPIILTGLFLVSYKPEAFSRRSHVSNRDDKPIKGAPDKDEYRALRRARLRSILRSGIFLAVSGAAAYAVGNVLRGAAIQEWNEPILGGLIGAVSGAALHFVLNPTVRRFWSQLKTASNTGLLLFSCSGAFTISGQITAIASMRYIPVSIATLITLSTPVLVTPLSYFLLKNEEGIRLLTVVGIVLVLSGISMVILW